jgi:hypothetical protein
MYVRRIVPALAALFGIFLAAPSPAHAGHHLWRFSQLYSNYGGSVQYIQLVVTEDGEQNVGTFTITSGANVFHFVNNLPSMTTGTNKWILVGTANLASLPGGVTPDYIIPENFFSTSGGTLVYATTADMWNYGSVPTDGVNALFRSGGVVTTAPNVPQNFNLQSGAINLAAPVPAVPAKAIAVAIGVLLLAGSGLLRRRNASAAV